MNKRTLKRLNKAALSASIVLALTACSKTSSTPSSAVAVTDANLRTNATAMNEMVTGYRVMRNDVLKANTDGETLLSAESGDASNFLKKSPLVDERTVYVGKFPTEDTPILATTASDTLMVGLPIGNLGEERVLGGVITGVSAHEDDNLGSLKLSDFPMLSGKLMIAGLDTKTPQMVFVGCAAKCTEASPRIPLLAFPITAVDAKNGLLMIDLSAVGRGLDLLAMEDPTGEGTGLKSVDSVATTFDASAQTIVFDIESHMKAVDPKNPLPDTTITVRWFLKSSAAFDSAFTPREANDAVGFFMTDIAAKAKIKRWSMARFGDAGIKYYIKHVPAEWQPAFASAFDEWNATFVASFGRKIFDYEFIPEGDARNALLVPGDIRYNIVEWDLINQATYGGLGPSEGNGFTGEIINANVLIQGPTIMKLYTDWYKVSAAASELKAQGKTAEAATLIRDFTVASDAAMKPAMTHSLTLNKSKSFVIHAERPELADPHTQRNDFEEVPPGVDFKTYMNGYFHDMLTHELGHNLGLRHNFRGNMGATDTNEKGSTSRSIMEYLGRRYRFLDHVGEYDVMAIKFGYAQVTPTHSDWYCTDEDKWAPKKKGLSPECSADDATSDPYSFFEFRLARVIDYLTARGESYAPVWTLDNLKREMNVALNGLLSYASVEEALAAKLTNFYGKAGRPADAKATQAYVLARVKQQLCDPNLDLVISGKYDPAAKALTLQQLQSLRETAAKAFAAGGVDLGFDINCAAVSTPVKPTP